MKYTLLSLALFLSATTAFAQLAAPADGADQIVPKSEFSRGQVLVIQSEKQDNFAGMNRAVQTVTIRITAGPEQGKEFTTENGILEGREDMRLHAGETVTLEKLEKSDGTVQYLIREKYRLPALELLIVAFVAIAFLLGGTTSLMSLLGLAVSVLILVGFVVPQVVSGRDPLTICLIASFLIACTSLYLAHGFNKRTSVALLSTLLTLALAAALAVVAVHVGKLFGMGSEESLFLQMGILQNVNLKGLLLGGIIIGCLGVLDDVTTAQTASVDEIRKANPNLSARELYASGMSVGREHIASLINTLFLAYAGASLPLLLLLQVQQDSPLWLTLNSEFLAEEIIRTLVGSSTLLFAVPISTYFAVRLLKGDGASKGHAHGHHHTHLHSSGHGMWK